MVWLFGYGPAPNIPESSNCRYLPDDYKKKLSSAIRKESQGTSGKTVVIGKKCSQCLLCVLTKVGCGTPDFMENIRQDVITHRHRKNIIHIHELEYSPEWTEKRRERHEVRGKGDGEEKRTAVKKARS